MTIDTNTKISITETNQNFSKAAKVVDGHGTAVIMENNVPRYLVIDFCKAEKERVADDVILAMASGDIGEKNLAMDYWTSTIRLWRLRAKYTNCTNCIYAIGMLSLQGNKCVA